MLPCSMARFYLALLTSLVFLPITLQYLTVSQVAGGGGQALASIGAGAPANNVSLDYVRGTAYLPMVGVLMTSSNGVLRVVDGLISWYAGSTVAGSANGIVTAATFNNPTRLTVDNDVVYILDYGNNAVRKILPIPSLLVQTVSSGFFLTTASDIV